jgi:aspartate racemase
LGSDLEMMVKLTNNFKIMIGIIGGIGPAAGVDLYNRIIRNTLAKKDQDHIPVILSSMPGEIVDRTAYLLGKSFINPAYCIAKLILKLEQSGVSTVGIACNTAHSPEIFNVLLNELMKSKSRVEIINMINETIRIIKSKLQKGQKVGVLCTSGSYKANVFQKSLCEAGITPELLEFERHHFLVHDAVYNATYGIKSSSQLFQQALGKLNLAIEELKKKGVKGIILGCTEIAMVEEQLDLNGLISFNPSDILARTLIQKTFPQKLISL